MNYRSDIIVELQDHMGNDASIARAARTSYANLPTLKPHDKLIQYLVKNGHGSPLEHTSMTFLVEAPIFVAREHMRHRIGHSYNEVSGRLMEFEPVYYVPDMFRTQEGRYSYQPMTNSDVPRITMKEAYRWADSTYRALLKDGVAKELARSVLPVGTYTRYAWTCNLRSLLHFHQLRSAPDAQHEIRLVASFAINHAYSLFPLAVQAYYDYNGEAP